MSKFENLIGKRFGRLLVEKQDLTSVNTRWICICDCGTYKNIMATHLKSGKTQSCGCIYTESRPFVHRSHGLSKKIPEYAAWENMKRRCYYSKHNRYKHYGGRGIIVCDNWRYSFETFYRDMGSRPSSLHSLDRYPNKNGNYEPNNCRWATLGEQARNTSRNVMIEYEGEIKCVTDWAKQFKIKSSLIRDRLKLGWPIDKRLFMAANNNKFKNNQQ